MARTYEDRVHRNGLSSCSGWRGTPWFNGTTGLVWMRWAGVAAVLATLSGPLADPGLADPPSLQYFYPAGGQQGQTVEIFCSGAYPRWPVQAWCNQAGVKIEAVADKKQKLRVTIDQDAECGLVFVRIYDDQGATTVRPFAVGSLAEVTEQEPNDSPEKPHLLKASTVINGKLNKAGDVDHFSIALKEGQTLVASAVANTTFNSPMDAVLQVCDARGFVLMHNDDARGLDPLAIFRAPRDGVYLTRIFAFPSAPNSTIGFAGAETYVYRLMLTGEAVVDHTFPLAVERGKPIELAFHGWNLPVESRQTLAATADLFRTVFLPETAGTLRLPAFSFPPTVAAENGAEAAAQAIRVPAAITGRIGKPGEVDRFMMECEKGQKVNIAVESRKLGYALDALLKLRDGQGKVVSENDDAGGSPDAALSFTAPEAGHYTLELGDVNGHGGFRFIYRLTVIPAVPDYALTLAADAYVVQAGKTIEIPVTIERREGFAEEIVIEAKGLPDGASAKPVVSESKGDSAKSVKLVIQAAQKGSTVPFSVTGKARDSGAMRAATFPVAGTPRRLDAVWLTVTP